MQTPSTKSQLHQLVEESHQRQLAQVDALTPAEREATGTPQHWSAKDILAHVLYWKERLAERLEAAKSSETMAAGDAMCRRATRRTSRRTRRAPGPACLRATRASTRECLPASTRSRRMI